jgi:hypothetical protein
MDGRGGALAKEKIQWAEDWYFTMKFALQKLSEDYTDVTPMPGIRLISAYIYNPVRKLQSFEKWDPVMDINSDGKTYYISQYHHSYRKYVENQECGLHGSLPLIKPESIPSNNPFSCAMSLTLGQSCCDQYDLSSDDAEYSVLHSMTEMMLCRSNHIAHIWLTARLYLNSLSELP